MDRLARDPAIHIYHYAPYEPTALGRLMGRHGIREDDVDRLLRGDVLVDLYGVVRQGVRASVESYSIKRLEPLYRYTREIGLRDVGPVIAAYEAWLQAGGEAGHDDAALRKIERYNHDDVVSTMLLRDWLEGRRLELATRMAQRAFQRALAMKNDRLAAEIRQRLETYQEAVGQAEDSDRVR